MMAAIDDVIAKYAAQCEKIYNERTAGDHTWTGVLGVFLTEVKKAEASTTNPKCSWPHCADGTCRFTLKCQE